MDHVDDGIIKENVPEYIKPTLIMHLVNKDVLQLISTESLVQILMFSTLHGSGHPTIKPAETANSHSKAARRRGVKRNSQEYVGADYIAQDLFSFSFIPTHNIKEGYFYGAQEIWITSR